MTTIVSPTDLSLDDAADLLIGIQRILWGDGPDTQWSLDTLDAIADIMREYGLSPIDGSAMRAIDE